MRYKPFVVSVLLSLAVITCTLVVFLTDSKPEKSGISQLAVQANEVDNLVRSGDTDAASAKSQQLVRSAQEVTKQSKKTGGAGVWIVCAVCVAAVDLCVLYVYKSVIKPFHKLEGYADKLAAGEFDTALDYERTNYFGRFTWAFDSMRREIVKARACEREAIDNNKTVIASLSHDLKTPVASISAYSEALVNGLYSDTEEMFSYLDVISKKCEEITRLTNDMITHSIGELGALKMDPSSVELSELIETVVRESAAKDVNFEQPLFPVRVYADKNRLKQLVGNLIGNAQKYAPGRMDITVTKHEHMFLVHFRDYGKGIPDEELPFVFDKFYRGSNTADISGSGLGLYIVRYIAQRSGGDVSAKNCPDGLEMTVSLPEQER